MVRCLSGMYENPRQGMPVLYIEGSQGPGGLPHPLFRWGSEPKLPRLPLQPSSICFNMPPMLGERPPSGLSRSFL